MSGGREFPKVLCRESLGVALCLVLCLCAPAERPEKKDVVPITQAHEGGGARLALHLDRDSLSTAESASLRLEVECGESDGVGFPDLDDGLGEFAVPRSESLPARLVANRRVVRGREYELQPFLPGEYEIPALTVVLNGSEEISTTPVTVSVTSVLNDPSDADLRDIAEPVDMPVPWWWWALAALAIAAAVAAATWYWHRRRRQDAPGSVPASEAALAALDALLAESLLEDGRFKLFYQRLSDIVRRYIESRFGIHAPEQTTEEFLAGLAAAPEIGADHQLLLRRFLGRADMVKFAKFVPGADETGASVDAARSFIEQTVPDATTGSEDSGAA